MSARPRGVALLATARDSEEASGWQAQLREAGIASIIRGHRPEGSEERRPSFSGADLYVPGAVLRQAREALTGVVPPDQFPNDDRPFPWLWLAAVPIGIGVAAGVVAAVLLAN